MNKLTSFFRSMWPSATQVTVNASPAPSKGGIGHSGSKRPHPCHSRPKRVARRKAAKASRRRNRR